MIKNIIDAELPVEVEDQVVQTIRNMESNFPFLLALNPEDRQAIPKIGKRSLDFVERSLMHAKENKNLVPPLVNLDEFDRDYRLMVQLRRVLSVAESFTRKIKDTYMAVGSEAYESSRDFYDYIKRGASRNEIGCEEIRRDLAARFKKQLTTEEDPPGETTVTTQS